MSTPGSANKRSIAFPVPAAVQSASRMARGGNSIARSVPKNAVISRWNSVRTAVLNSEEPSSTTPTRVAGTARGP